MIPLLRDCECVRLRRPTSATPLTHTIVTSAIPLLCGRASRDSSLSDGSTSATLKSPAVSSSAITSPSHRRTTGPIRRAKGGRTPEEDETLRNAVAVYNGKSWKKIVCLNYKKEPVGTGNRPWNL